MSSSFVHMMIISVFMYIMNRVLCILLSQNESMKRRKAIPFLLLLCTLATSLLIPMTLETLRIGTLNAGCPLTPQKLQQILSKDLDIFALHEVGNPQFLDECLRGTPFAHYTKGAEHAGVSLRFKTVISPYIRKFK